jgi:hypothetical protein
MRPSTPDLPKTYSINVTCYNCDHDGVALLKYGEPVPESILCPNCGCKTARNKYRSVLPCSSPSIKWDWSSTIPYSPYPIILTPASEPTKWHITCEDKPPQLDEGL